MKDALANLIAPITTEDFLAQYWEQSPLRVARSKRDYFGKILHPQEIEEVLTTACLTHSDSIELLGEAAKNETGLQRHSMHFLAEAFNRGGTIRLLHTQRFHPPLRHLTRDLERGLSCPVGANLYWTPPQQQGLQRHWDMHDVLVLQIAGRKHWRVCEAPVALPLQSPPAVSLEEQRTLMWERGAVPTKTMHAMSEQSAIQSEFTLEQGDTLYLPRGVPHEAWTGESASAHLTIGFHVLTWTDLLGVALGQVANQDARFRKALPMGFAASTLDEGLWQEQVQALLQSFVERLNVTNAFEELAEIFIRNRPDVGSPGESEMESALDADTRLAHHSGRLCRVIVQAEAVALYWGHGKFEAPRVMETALRFIAQTSSFRVGEIPGGLSQRNQIALVRQLVVKRFLRVLSE